MCAAMTEATANLSSVLAKDGLAPAATGLPALQADVFAVLLALAGRAGNSAVGELAQGAAVTAQAGDGTSEGCARSAFAVQRGDRRPIPGCDALTGETTGDALLTSAPISR